MTTPTQPTTPAEAFRTEIRAAFDSQADSIAELRTDLETLIEEVKQMREGLKQAASQPAAPAGTFSEMMIDNIIMTTDDKGKPAYKAKGAPYQKHGVRVWDEVLPLLGIDPASLKPGPNPQSQPIPARVLMGETTNRETGEKGVGPRKVTGKA